MRKNQQQNWPTEIERIATFPRGKDKELRLSIMSFRSPEGRTIEYWSLRLHFRDQSGNWIPMNRPATIRAAERIPLFEAALGRARQDSVIADMLSGDDEEGEVNNAPRHYCN